MPEIPSSLATYYDAEGADELVLLDITASSDSREIMVNVVREVAERLFIPFTVGGGMRSVADVRRMLEAGADKVSLNTAAVQNPDLVSEASDHFGAQWHSSRHRRNRHPARRPSRHL